MTSDNGHGPVSALIGAWALDACSAAEAALVEAHLSGCADCAGEARAARETAAGLLLTASSDLGDGSPPADPSGDGTLPGGSSSGVGSAPVEPPGDGSMLPGPAGAGDRALRSAPRGLRDRLFGAAPVRRRPAPRTPAWAKPYAAQIAALDLMLTGLAEGDWRRIAAYQQMSVHDLLAHLIAVDGIVAGALGLSVDPPLAPETDAAARTAAVLELEQSRPVAETLTTWRDQAEAVCRALPRGPDATTVNLVGWPMPINDALLARAFETWIHGEDIAGATDSPAITPLPEHLHPMADLAVRTLPLVTAHHLPDAAGRQLRLHLTGPGGGSWTVPLGPSEAAGVDAELTIDIVEFCRLVGDRRDPAQLPVTVTGDRVLATEWLAAVPALAPYP